MTRMSRVWAIAAALALASALPATAAQAADASGCSGSVRSAMADGSALDSAEAPGAGATQDDPLVIDPQGTVAWQGATDTAITSGTWSVSVMGLSFLNGTIDNPDGTTSGSGTVDLAAAPAPVQWVLQTKARIPVSGTMTGSGATCTGSGYIAGLGSSPMSSPLFLAGAAFAGIGLLMGLWLLLGTKATATVASTGTMGGGAAS